MRTCVIRASAGACPGALAASADLTTAKEAFAARLVEAMLDCGYRSARSAKSGVDVAPLAQIATVTREMARRYTEGKAIPDPNKMQVIAAGLGVRIAWLRDGEGDKHDARRELVAAQPVAEYRTLSQEALQVALAWSKLSPDTRTTMRDVIFMLSLGEKRFPWLRRGRPEKETYAQWEARQLQNFQAMSQLHSDRSKAKIK